MADQHSAKVTSQGIFPETVYTPNLEQLSERGIRFERAFAQNPLCTPSRVSCLTGRYPQNHGYYGLPQFTTHLQQPPFRIATAFDVFDALGYRTAAIGKIHTPPGLLRNVHYERNVLERSYGSHHNGPYEEYLHQKGILKDRDDQLLQEGGFDGRPSRLDYEDTSEYWSVEQTKQFINEDQIVHPGVEEYIQNRPGYSSHQDKPFFVWLSLMRPHNPYTPPEQFWEMYPSPEDIGLPPSVDEDLSDKPPTQQRVRELQRSGEMFPSAVEPKTYEAQRRRCVKGYLGCVSMIDDCVGRMIDFLDERGLLENTLVIYCSDHGEFVTEHGLLEKAPGISYDAISRVPLIWSWPSHFEEGAVRSELVELIDILPTLVHQVADDSMNSTDGCDISGHLTGDNPAALHEYAVTETPWLKSVRTKNQRLTIYPRGYFGSNEDEYYEMYDYKDDPWEMTNLGGEDSGHDEFQRLTRLAYEFSVTQSRPVTAMPSTPQRNVEPLEPAQSTADIPDDGTLHPNLIHTFLREHDGSLHL